jgi:hypothetical protein
VSDAAPCRCNRHVPASAAKGQAEPQPLHFARRATSFAEARAVVRQVEEARWAREVHRGSQPPDASVDFAQQLLASLDRTLDGGPSCTD